MENKHDINITDYEDVKKYYEDFKDLFEKGEKEQARQMMSELLEKLETNVSVRKAGSVAAVKTMKEKYI